MSTLGSMARAAEYAAAQSARARQVSHETEEQNLPPKSTPVSLSAFTKGLSTRGNKGNKTWKPLTTSDLGTEEDASDIITTPEHIPLSTEKGMESRSTPRLFTIPTQDSEEELRIPTAPKAMLAQHNRLAGLLDSATRRVSTHPVGDYSQRSSPQATRGASVYGSQGYPVDRAESMPAPPMVEHRLLPSNYLTPSREDIAEALQERDRQHTLNMANLQPAVPQQQQQQRQAPPGCSVFDDSPVHGYHVGEYGNHMGDYSVIRYLPVYPPSYDITPPAFYPVQQANARMDNLTVFQSVPPSYREPRHHANHPTSLYHPESRKPDIPYDRARMMEQYKATLAKAASERKGKTVLHNPELHQSQASPQKRTPDSAVASKEHSAVQTNIDAIVSWSELEGIRGREKKDRKTSFAQTNENEQSMEEHPYDSYEMTQKYAFPGKNHTTTASLEGAPPGLQLPTDGSGDIKSNGLKEFPDDFYTLKAVSMAEVKRIRRLAEEARDDLAGTFKQPFFHGQACEGLAGNTRQPLFSSKDGESVNSVRARAAEDWFYGPPSVRDTAYCTDLVAKMHDSAIQDKALAEESEEEKAVEGAIVGNVIKNVVGIWQNCKKPEDMRTLPFKIKPVPEYAIDRPGVMTGGLSIFSSFFEENPSTGEVEKAIPTPKRIARDPRFQFAAPREALKLSFEERLAKRGPFARRIVI